jgi:hydrogenase maturation protease
LIRIVGLGSPFGDDRAGWRVIERLRGQLPDAIDLVSLDRPGAALVQWMEGVDELVIVDALRGSRPPGTVEALDPAAVGAADGPAWSSHSLDLCDTFALAARLGMAPRLLSVYAIYIKELDKETKAVSEGCRQLAAALQARLGD